VLGAADLEDVQHTIRRVREERAESTFRNGKRVLKITPVKNNPSIENPLTKNIVSKQVSMKNMFVSNCIEFLCAAQMKVGFFSWLRVKMEGVKYLPGKN
jgi:hypothetical protein